MFQSRGTARARASAPSVSAAQSPIRRRRPRSSHRAGGRRRQHRAPQSPELHRSPRSRKFHKKEESATAVGSRSTDQAAERVELLTTLGEPARPSRADKRSERLTRGNQGPASNSLGGAVPSRRAYMQSVGQQSDPLRRLLAHVADPFFANAGSGRRWRRRWRGRRRRANIATYGVAARNTLIATARRSPPGCTMFSLRHFRRSTLRSFPRKQE